MPSCRTEQLLAELTASYDQAYEALKRDDLERVAAVLQDTDALVAQLPASLPEDEGLVELHSAATSSHGRLTSALHELRGEMRGQLTSIRQGRRALQGYRGIGNTTGRRIRSEG